MPNAPTFPIAIIGAGFAGIGVAIELQRAGLQDFTIYESAQELGGTWRDNTYPGCACDVPSHVYSYSFEPNPDWSRAYSPQPEIWAYIKHCAKKYGLEDKIVYNTQIIGAEFDPEGWWTLFARDGEEIRARAVMMGAGGLSRPLIPDFPGLDTLDRPSWHSARWRHDIDLTGKRVAVVGTGASAIQFIPEIAQDVDQLYVFQRSPPWCLPRPDREFPAAQKAAFQAVPGMQKLYRSAIYWGMEALGTGFAKDQRVLKTFQKLAERNLNKTVPPGPLRDALTPDYLMGCKRILFTSDFYPAMIRDNVQLIPSAAERFSPGTVHAQGQDYSVDAVIFGTGFHTTDFLSDFEVIGLDGVELNKAWKDGAEAYYGVSVSGFPNFYIFAGPNTSLGHNSIIFMLECQAHFARQCVETIVEDDLRFLDVRPAAQARFNQSLQQRLERTVWNTGGCHNWYLDETGRNTTLWPGYTWQYWLETRRVDPMAFSKSY